MTLTRDHQTGRWILNAADGQRTTYLRFSDAERAFEVAYATH